MGNAPQSRPKRGNRLTVDGGKRPRGATVPTAATAAGTTPTHAQHDSEETALSDRRRKNLLRNLRNEISPNGQPQSATASLLQQLDDLKLKLAARDDEISSLRRRIEPPSAPSSSSPPPPPPAAAAAAAAAPPTGVAKKKSNRATFEDSLPAQSGPRLSVSSLSVVPESSESQLGRAVSNQLDYSLSGGSGTSSTSMATVSGKRHSRMDRSLTMAADGTLDGAAASMVVRSGGGIRVRGSRMRARTDRVDRLIASRATVKAKLDTLKGLSRDVGKIVRKLTKLHSFDTRYRDDGSFGDANALDDMSSDDYDANDDDDDEADDGFGRVDSSVDFMAVAAAAERAMGPGERPLHEFNLSPHVKQRFGVSALEHREHHYDCVRAVRDDQPLPTAMQLEWILFQCELTVHQQELINALSNAAIVVEEAAREMASSFGPTGDSDDDGDDNDSNYDNNDDDSSVGHRHRQHARAESSNHEDWGDAFDGSL